MNIIWELKIQNKQILLRVGQYSTFKGLINLEISTISFVTLKVCFLG